ncbi:hypothetical protein [Moorena sp. SIO3B2]|uniref:hypothetical protein n=1 Tax=Moorena sp. SIO3B2 TaxID=2607827 RepID=UPI0013C9523F|nr:hypothetical protein [Moorena sp. SIO3B2]NEP35610.1 hypothetical protein [Moorena sp. SIO3B2]
MSAIWIFPELFSQKKSTAGQGFSANKNPENEEYPIVIGANYQSPTKEVDQKKGTPKSTHWRKGNLRR